MKKRVSHTSGRIRTNVDDPIGGRSTRSTSHVRGRDASQTCDRGVAKAEERSVTHEEGERGKDGNEKRRAWEEAADRG